MSYWTQPNRNQVKVPTAITVIVVGLTILVLTRLVSPSVAPSKASKQVLVQIKVLNQSATQAAVFWETTEKSSGWVVYGDSKGVLNKTAIDERDYSDKKSAYQYHFVILRNLEQNRDYFFDVVSNNQLVGKGNSEPFALKTTTGGATTSSLAYGKLVSESGNPLSDVPVVLTSESGLALAGLTKTSGEWLIPISKSLGEGEKIALDFYSETGQKTHVLTDAKHISPLPQTTIIGRDYSFINQENVLSATTQTGNSPVKKIDIFYPKDKMIIDSVRPLIKGIAIPNSPVRITIHSASPMEFDVQADSLGLWSVNLQTDLLPGKHTITLSTKDESGSTVTVSRDFTIAKSGEQVMGTATGSATPTVVQTTAVPMAVITAPVVPTANYSTPTAILPKPSASAKPTKSPPESGSSILPYALGSASFILLGAGLLLAF